MPTSGGPRKGTDRRQRSLNGTYVNQERIERRAAARRRVQIGKFRLVHCTDA
jgi:pSer/pThr/pTyr-binding forkhead associated (FHA) protein